MNLFISSRSQVRWPSTASLKALEEEALALSKKSHKWLNQCLSQALLRKERFLLQSSGDTTIEEICQSESITKTHFLSSSGKYQLNLWTIITIFPSSLMVPDKSSTHIVPSLFWAHTICWTKVAIKSCPLFLS